MLAYGDAEARIWVIDRDGKNKRLVGDDGGMAQHDFSWSPDARWLACSMEDANGYRSLHVWDSESEPRGASPVNCSASTTRFFPPPVNSSISSQTGCLRRSSAGSSGITWLIATPAFMH